MTNGLVKPVSGRNQQKVLGMGHDILMRGVSVRHILFTYVKGPTDKLILREVSTSTGCEYGR